jgi:catechol 2,3-dioxygenase-like lactoylglutathione lyase family enzyme
MCARQVLGAGLIFTLGLATGWLISAFRAAEASSTSPDNPYSTMLHVGIVVKNLDESVAKWRAMGFTDIRTSPPNRGVDRMYHGKPNPVTIKQAFIHGTNPMIELIEPVDDVPSPWRDYLDKHGEVLHHLAYRVPDTRPELEKLRRLGLEAIGEGKWPEGSDHWGTFHYVQEPRGGAVIELISRIPRK